MIRQIDFPTFSIIFTYVERLWDPLIKTLQTLHSKKLNLLKKTFNLFI
jgi:hypothetical protein